MVNPIDPIDYGRARRFAPTPALGCQYKPALVPGSLLVHSLHGSLFHVWIVGALYVVLLAAFMTAKFRKGDWKDIQV